MKMRRTPVHRKKVRTSRAPRAAVEAVAHGHGDGEADQGARRARRPARRLVAAAVAWPTRKSAVSRPSRITAVKASTEGPSAALGKGAVDRALQVALDGAAWRRIQKSIQVTTPAATSIITPSKICS